MAIYKINNLPFKVNSSQGSGEGLVSQLFDKYKIVNYQKQYIYGNNPGELGTDYFISAPSNLKIDQKDKYYNRYLEDQIRVYINTNSKNARYDVRVYFDYVPSTGTTYEQKNTWVTRNGWTTVYGVGNDGYIPKSYSTSEPKYRAKKFSIEIETSEIEDFSIDIQVNAKAHQFWVDGDYLNGSTNYFNVKDVLLYKKIPVIVLKDKYKVEINDVQQPNKYFDSDYKFNFEYSIIKGYDTIHIPSKGDGTEVYLLEYTTQTDTVIYSTAKDIYTLIGNNPTGLNEYPQGVSTPDITYNGILSKLVLKSNTTYKLFIRTYYGTKSSNDYVNSNIIIFKTPIVHPEVKIKINTGYYEKYFNINGYDPYQSISNGSNNLIKYTKNQIPINNNKRTITLNGSYYYYFFISLGDSYLEESWFNKNSNDKPVEIGFYYIDSKKPLTNIDTDIKTITDKGIKISTDPYNISQTDNINILYSDPTLFRSCAFSTTIDTLKISTTYYFISFIKKQDGTIKYGNVETFTTLPDNILSYQNPKPGVKWYQIYDNWGLTTSNTNRINPFYIIKPDVNKNYPIFYYFNTEFKSEKNYQFRTIVENFYDIKKSYNDSKTYGSSFTKFTIKTPWGESNLFPVPYFKNHPSIPTEPYNNLINLFLYSNINTIDIPNKPIDNISSSSSNSNNPKNPITYIANGTFNIRTNPYEDFKSQGLIYTDVNDTDWILQGYAFFNFFNPRKIDQNLPYNTATASQVNNMRFDGNDEVISIMDTTNNTPIGCKGWHLIEKKNQLVWFDKYIPTDMDDIENSRNLPVGGNPDDYYSNKTSEEKWRQNNYVAKYIPYQTFNISFSYSNNSNSKIDMYVGSKLPKFENNTINYFDDYKKIATLDNNTTPNCEFIGLEGNQYIYFVAEPIDFNPNQTLATYSTITLRNFKFAGSYNDGNNILYGITESNISISTINTIDNATYSIKLGTSNNVDNDSTKYNTPITLNSSAGNGTFKAGIWENGVWNNGWRDDTTKKDFYKIDQFFSYNKDKKWQIRISGATSSVTEFSIGDKVTISNIVAIDINDERKLLKNYYTVIEATKNYISVEFETDFPLRRVEIDSDEHRIGVTKNIWLSGIFLNGYFKGIWNNGVFSGYPLITKMDESHWIDGVFNGGHFTAKKYSVKFDNIGNVSYNVDNSKRLGLTFSTPHKLNDNDSIVIYDDKENLVGSTIVLSVIDEMNLITGLTWETVSNFKYFNNLTSGIVHSLISTGLAQNMDFYSNNVSKVSSLTSLRTERVFSYNSWIDVNYSNQSAVNIGKPYYFLEKASNKSYSENNLYGYPTNDILSSNSTFRDSFSVSSRKYKLGKKWKVFNDLVGDSSTFEEYFNTTDTTDGLELFNTQGWDISLNDKYDTNISINGANSHLGTTMSYFSIYFNNYDYSNTIKEGDLINLNGWKSTNRTDNTAGKNNFIGLTVSYVMTHQIGITASPRFGYATQSLPDTNYTMIGFDNFSEHKNDDIKIKTLATMSYFGEPNGTIGVTNSVGPAYGTQSVNTYTIDLNKSKYMWSLDITLDNTLVFSRTPEPLNTSTSTIGKELKIDSTGDGGILNLIPAYDVSNRTNGGDVNTLEKSSYTMIEFDVLQNNSATNSYLDPNLGNVPIIHFNNLNYITKNFTNAGITYSQTIPTKYLPINTNVNHLSTSGTKKQEFFYNKRNLLMNFKGNGLLGKDSTELFLDNIKMYQVDMIPFFQYFKKSNINISVQIPSNGKSPSINYTTDDTTTNIGSTTDTNTIITYFTDSLLIPDTQAPEGVNWITDFGLTSSVI